MIVIESLGTDAISWILSMCDVMYITLARITCAYTYNFSRALSGLPLLSARDCVLPRVLHDRFFIYKTCSSAVCIVLHWLSIYIVSAAVVLILHDKWISSCVTINTCSAVYEEIIFYVPESTNFHNQLSGNIFFYNNTSYFNVPI